MTADRSFKKGLMHLREEDDQVRRHIKIRKCKRKIDSRHDRAHLLKIWVPVFSYALSGVPCV